jgi:hypothetical protein
MRTRVLFTVLGSAALAIMAFSPCQAQAWHWRHHTTVVVVPAAAPVVTTSYYAPAPPCFPSAPPPPPLPVVAPVPTPVAPTVVIRERPRLLFPSTTTVIVRP